MSIAYTHFSPPPPLGPPHKNGNVFVFTIGSPVASHAQDPNYTIAIIAHTHTRTTDIDAHLKRQKLGAHPFVRPIHGTLTEPTMSPARGQSLALHITPCLSNPPPHVIGAYTFSHTHLALYFLFPGEISLSCLSLIVLSV